MGLDSGADDYMIKLFALSELCARLRALMRREASDKKGMLLIAPSSRPATRSVERGGRPIELSATEYALFEYFIRHPNQVVTRDMIETHVWSYDFDCTSNVVDVYVRRLRRKIDEPFEVKLLETVRGVGYRLRDPARYPGGKTMARPQNKSRLDRLKSLGAQHSLPPDDMVRPYTGGCTAHIRRNRLHLSGAKSKVDVRERYAHRRAKPRICLSLGKEASYKVTRKLRSRS